MSFSPFDGVVLDDGRPPVPGARAVLLHRAADRALAARQGRAPLGPEALGDRAAACRELLAHGLGPEQLRGLGLPLGSPRDLRSFASLLAHLEAYLQAVAAEGLLEPEVALWRAAEAEARGRRGWWVERRAEDGALELALEGLKPVRLRALSTLGLPVVFRLATTRGGGHSGLFGGTPGLAAWLMEGLEAHGEALAGDLHLAAPEGWAEAAPWGPALDGLFEGPLALDDAGRGTLRRALLEGPFEVLRGAVEQACAWVAEGVAPEDILLVHPRPAEAGPLLASLFAAEGLSLQVRGALRPLRHSEAWAPLWALMEGLAQEDPCRLAAGLRASTRADLRAWSDHLALADQTGPEGFRRALEPLRPEHREGAEAALADLQALLAERGPATRWAQRLETLAYALRLPVEREAFYGPLAMLSEAQESWAFRDFQEALALFLDTATDPGAPRSPGALRLLAPGALLAEPLAPRCTLLLDLSEGAWPATPRPNPDLDWSRQADLNRALLRATAEGQGDPAFPPALQRFWLPRAEHEEAVPRAFQVEAYAFNAVLALTREQLVALSPAQDAEGRPLAQGPFWNALEGAGPWAPDPVRAASALRFRWEGGPSDPEALDRARAAQARTPEAALLAEAAPADRTPGLLEAWLKGQPAASPTALEGLARCPFRARAERVWRLEVHDLGGREVMARGSLLHALLEALLRPCVGAPHWPAACREAHGLRPGQEVEDLRRALEALWQTHADAWLAAHAERVPVERWPDLAAQVTEALPNLAAYVAADLEAGPTKFERCLLRPEAFPVAEHLSPHLRIPTESGWRRQLLGLELPLQGAGLPRAEGGVLAVAGTVDRLERWEHPEHPPFLRVVDYKSSSLQGLRPYAEEDAPFGSHLQLPLYAALAAEVHGLPATAVLVPLREEEPKAFDGQLRELARSEAEGRPWRTRLAARLQQLVDRLEQGHFPPTPGPHCTHCALSAVCGRPVDIEAFEPEEA